MPLMPEIASHIQAKELQAISAILDSKPITIDFVLQDLCKGKAGDSRAGAKGMSAKQVQRAAVVVRLFGFSLKAAKAMGDALVKNPNYHPERIEGSLLKTKCIIIADV